jgi:hypothetical protein
MKLRLTRMLLVIVMSGTFTATANAETKQFSAPHSQGYLLDWCLRWGKQESPDRCGKPVAESFCKSQGYKRSVGNKKWNDPGKSTRQIASGDVCNAQFCDSFKYIKCEK